VEMVSELVLVSLTAMLAIKEKVIRHPISERVVGGTNEMPNKDSPGNVAARPSQEHQSKYRIES
jgi:hypothetical protein